MLNKFNYIYGPVYSWRLGRSLGVDLVFDKKKNCNFDCVYCQLGRTVTYTTKRKCFVPIDKLKEEIKHIPDLKLDYITFSGSGEPTLADNLNEAVHLIKEHFNIPLAILTNSSLLDNLKVREELLLIDFVCLKIDAVDKGSFRKINHPFKNINLNSIIEGILEFKKIYKNKLALQIMFIKENKEYVHRLVELAIRIMPDEIQINTPLRPSRSTPLSKEETFYIKDIFLKEFFTLKVKIISVYDKIKKQKVLPLSKENTNLRRSILV